MGRVSDWLIVLYHCPFVLPFCIAFLYYLSVFFAAFLIVF